MQQGQRGSFVWACERFNRDGLTQLLNDLSNRETQGVSQAVCLEIQASLACVVNEATEFVESGIFARPLYIELQKFEEEYKKWNGPDEDRSVEACAHRMECIKRMRKYRQKSNKRMKSYLKKMRRDQHILSQEYDLKAIDNIYDAFARICEKAPEIFSHLAKAVKKYSKRKDT